MVYAPAGTPSFHLNLSHSNDLALIAGTRQGPLAVDVERVRFVLEANQIAAKFFSANEGSVINPPPCGAKNGGIFPLLDAQKALLKATGEGIADALPRIEVSLAPGQPTRLSKIKGDVLTASLWRLSGLAPAPGFVGALAIKTDSVRLACWRWSINQ